MSKHRDADLRGRTFPADESLAGADADLGDAQLVGVDLSGATLAARRSSAPIFGMRRRRHHLELDGYGVERV
jgi:uncharacterized protein YjbI with pentapeptide repeats